MGWGEGGAMELVKFTWRKGQWEVCAAFQVNGFSYQASSSLQGGFVLRQWQEWDPSSSSSQSGLLVGMSGREEAIGEKVPQKIPILELHLVAVCVQSWM